MQSSSARRAEGEGRTLAQAPAPAEGGRESEKRRIREDFVVARPLATIARRNGRIWDLRVSLFSILSRYFSFVNHGYTVC
jgi:hypothetical protein